LYSVSSLYLILVLATRMTSCVLFTGGGYFHGRRGVRVFTWQRVFRHHQRG
jgi:hypothetical protein